MVYTQFLDVVASFPIFFRFCAFYTLAADNFLHDILETAFCVSANVTPRVSYTARSGETLLFYLGGTTKGTRQGFGKFVVRHSLKAFEPSKTLFTLIFVIWHMVI